MNVKVGQITLQTTDSGTKAITGVGFQPKLVIFFGVGTGYSIGGERYILFGAYDGANDACFRNTRDDIGGTNNSQTTFSATHCIMQRGSSGAVGGRYAGSSLDADGFTLTVTNNAYTDQVINYLAVGGADVTAACGSGAVDASNPYTEVVTGLSALPNALILLAGHHLHTAASESATNNACFTIGFADGTNEGSVSGWTQNGTDPSNSTGVADNVLFRNPEQTRQITLTSFDDNGGGDYGFSLSVTGTANNAMDYIWIALTVPHAAAGTSAMLASGSPGDPISLTGAGFTPKLGLFGSAPHATAFDSVVDDYHVAVGAATGPSERAGCTMYDPDGVTGGDPDYINYTDAVLKGEQRDGADSFSVNAAVDFSAFTSGGATLLQDDIAPAAGKIAYLLLGETAAAGGSNLPLLQAIGEA